jgi:hypothetical protein
MGKVLEASAKVIKYFIYKKALISPSEVFRQDI